MSFETWAPHSVDAFFGEKKLPEILERGTYVFRR